MQVCEAQVVDRTQRVFKHRFGLGREAGDDVGADHDVGPRCARTFNGAGSVCPQVAALHPL